MTKYYYPLFALSAATILLAYFGLAKKASPRWRLGLALGYSLRPIPRAGVPA